MNSTLSKSNTAFNLFKTYLQTWCVFKCLSMDVYDIIRCRLNFMKTLVDGYPLDGNTEELKVICTNYATARKIMKELEENINHGLIKLYRYPI